MKKILNFFKKIFKINKPQPEFKPYVEKDTVCDKCGRLHLCIEEERLLDITRLNDSRQHYVPGMGVFCRDLEEKNEKENIDITM